MPYTMRPHGGRYCVFYEGTQRIVPGGCHDSRPDARRHLAALRINVEAQEGAKAMEDVVADGDLWDEVRRTIIGVMLPSWRLLFIEGAILGAEERPRTKAAELEPPDEPEIPFDWDAVNTAADDFLEGYSDRWWQQWSQTTQDSLRKAIRRARDNGLGPKSVVEDIANLFGKARAKRIAVTEMTRLMGAGAQATYQAAGVGEWMWQTVRDALVDPICDSLQGEVFLMTHQFEPAHVNCRCWPLPMTPVAAALAPVF